MGAGRNALIIFSFGTDADLPVWCLKVSHPRQRQRDLIEVEAMMKWTLCSSSLLSAHEYPFVPVPCSNNTDWDVLIQKCDSSACGLILGTVFWVLPVLQCDSLAAGIQTRDSNTAHIKVHQGCDVLIHSSRGMLKKQVCKLVQRFPVQKMHIYWRWILLKRTFWKRS